MRPSALRHPLAVLRQKAGISQKELANLVGKSAATIQAIELEKLNLSEELAMKISLETGISVKWLLDGNPNVEPFFDDRPDFSGEGRNYSRAVFERRRADRAAGKSGWSEQIFLSGVAGARLTAIEYAAINSPDRNIAHYRISKFLESMEKEFGLSRERLDEELLKRKLWRDFESLFEDPDGGEEVSSHRELVPSFIRAYEKLAKTFQKRTGKQTLQRPGIFPLIQWARKAMQVISPTRLHPLLKGKPKATGAPKLSA